MVATPARVLLCKSQSATLTSVQVSISHANSIIASSIILLLAVDGGWTPWSNWSDCSATCGNGLKQRERSCTAPPPQHGGKPCDGETLQVQDCFLQHCPVHCQWLQFSEWTPCSATCDGGVTSRTRGYIPAEHGGDECLGDLMEVIECNMHACPGNGMPHMYCTCKITQKNNGEG